MNQDIQGVLLLIPHEDIDALGVGSNESFFLMDSKILKLKSGTPITPRGSSSGNKKTRFVSKSNSKQAPVKLKQKEIAATDRWSKKDEVEVNVMPEDVLNPQRIEEFRQLFEMADADSSGRIDADELSVLLGKIGMGASKPSINDINTVFSEIQHGGGAVDFSVFVKFMSSGKLRTVNTAQVRRDLEVSNLNLTKN